MSGLPALAAPRIVISTEPSSFQFRFSANSTNTTQCNGTQTAFVSPECADYLDFSCVGRACEWKAEPHTLSGLQAGMDMCLPERHLPE